MELQDQIKEQYAARKNSDDLYNSVYSRLADEERTRKAIKLLNEAMGNFSSKTVLEIGAGQGHNIKLLNACGFLNKNIYMNELLPERIAAIKHDLPEVKIYEGDALKISFSEKYDCVFQSTVFTSILKAEDRKALAVKMWDLLKPGGVILWYDFVYNNPANAAVRKVSVSELRRLFPLAKHAKIRKVTLAPPIGRRVGRLYPLMNLPFLRTHVLGVFTKD
jgi:trans-aconitate methyltransferase